MVMEMEMIVKKEKDDEAAAANEEPLQLNHRHPPHHIDVLPFLGNTSLTVHSTTHIHTHNGQATHTTDRCCCWKWEPTRATPKAGCDWRRRQPAPAPINIGDNHHHHPAAAWNSSWNRRMAFTAADSGCTRGIVLRTRLGVEGQCRHAGVVGATNAHEPE